jgi:catechol 2,3-dioxygenase-like lactoylglutathione lyase family enzyme
MISVRYIVADVDEAVAFYQDNLDFKVDKHNPGKFAALLRDEFTLYLSAPGAGSGGQAGGDPRPGGWNRFMIVTNELDVLSYWADSNAVKLDGGKVGSFDGDEGEFFGREVVAGKDVIVKFHWDKRDPKAPIYSRAFSADAGRTWEWNWYSNFSRR